MIPVRLPYPAMRHLLLLLSLASLPGCPQSISIDFDAGGGVDAPGGSLDAPGRDAPAMMGTDAPTMMGTDAPMMGTDAPMTGTDAPTMSGTDAGMVGVACGMATCTGTDICCVNFTGGMVTMACSAPADCMGAPVSCDGPEDCARGEACCGMRGTGGGGSASCVPDASCTFGRLCHETADCTGTDMCCPLMGIGICSPRCFGGP